MWSEAEPCAEVAAIRDRGTLDGDPRTIGGARVQLEHGCHRRHVEQPEVEPPAELIAMFTSFMADKANEAETRG
jgi:hypothetical protein